MTRARTLVARAAAHIGGYGFPRAVVAFSGGVDSSVVLSLATRSLGPGSVTAVTAVSPSYPRGELDRAREVARGLGVSHRVATTREVQREAYARNDELRCFHCKSELYGVLRGIAVAESNDGTVVLAGANVDDAADFRPGLRAGELQDVRNPLLELGIGKAEVRAMARWLELSVADKPALACLSSRVAFGIRITPELLARIDVAEERVRALGFDVVRVRHLGDRASIEVPASQVRRLLADPRFPGVRRQLLAMGWPRVVVDLRGYRMGGLNPPAPTGHQPAPLR